MKARRKRQPHLAALGGVIESLPSPLSSSHVRAISIFQLGNIRRVVAMVNNTIEMQRWPATPGGQSYEGRMGFFERLTRNELLDRALERPHLTGTEVEDFPFPLSTVHCRKKRMRFSSLMLPCPHCRYRRLGHHWHWPVHPHRRDHWPGRRVGNGAGLFDFGPRRRFRHVVFE